MDWIKGNTLRMKLPLYIVSFEGSTGTRTAYEPPTDATVTVKLVGTYKTHTYEPTEVESNYVHFQDDATLDPDEYGIEVLVEDGDNNLRSFKFGQLNILEESQDLDVGEFLEDDEMVLDAVYFIQGEKGDPFTYEDFTEEQIAELQRPATEAAETANAAASAANAAAASANAAAENANTKATLADTAASNADAKATLANDAATNANTKAALADTAAGNADAATDRANAATVNTNAAIANAETATDRANAAAALNEELNEHPMIIGTNGNWWSWDADNDEYADTGTPSTNILAFGYDETTGEVFMDVVESSDYPNFTVENGDLVLEID